MNTIEKTTFHENKKMIFVFLILATGIAILSSLTSVQKALAPFLHPSQRMILAKISHLYGVDQPNLMILKIKDASGLQIEIYETSADNSNQTLKQKFDLAQDADAYMTIDKNSTNLALSDIDHDGHLDILAPSVDRNGNLRLNTFRYNPDLKSFEPYTQP